MASIKLPRKRDMVERLGGQPEDWAGQCHQAATAVVDVLGLENATVRRGYFTGETRVGAYFYGRPCQHSWCELRDGRVLDPTRFAFTAEPAWPLWVGDDRDYDIGGCRRGAPFGKAPDSEFTRGQPLVTLRITSKHGSGAARRVVGGADVAADAATKLQRPASAADLYTSPLFKSARWWAEREGDAWYILSALHGLLTPTVTIAPYELHMADVDLTHRAAWARRVTDRLQEPETGIFHAKVTLLAGRLYAEPLQDIFGDLVDVPLAGLGIGQRLAWFKRELAAT